MGEISQLERQLGRVNQQLKESERVIAQFQRQITELEQLRPATDTSHRSSSRASIKVTWREGEKAPCEMNISSYSAVDGTALYVRLDDKCVYAFTIHTSHWSQLPESPTTDCPSVIINDLLTLVGGDKSIDGITNQLFSLTGRRWSEEFPPMSTKRWCSTALCTETALIVAGGERDGYSSLKTVEVMNITTKQWSTAASLPKPLSYAPATVCGDQVYILGESKIYTYSVLTLVQSYKSFLASIRNIGAREATAPPVTQTTCVSIHGRLLAVGG